MAQTFMRKGLLRISKAERSIPTSKRKLLLIKLRIAKLKKQSEEKQRLSEEEKLLRINKWIDKLGNAVSHKKWPLQTEEMDDEALKALSKEKLALETVVKKKLALKALSKEELRLEAQALFSTNPSLYGLESRRKKVLGELKRETKFSEQVRRKALLRKLRLKSRSKEKAQFNEFILKKAKEIDLEHFIPKKARELALKYSPGEAQAHLAMAAHVKIIDALGIPKNKAEILKKTWALSFIVTKGIKLIPLPLTTNEHVFGVVGRTIEFPVRAEIMSRAVNHALYALNILSHEETKKGPKQIKEPKIIGGQKFLVPSASQIYLEKLSSNKNYLENKLKELKKVKPNTEVMVSPKDTELFLDVFANLTWHYCLNDRKLVALNITLSDTYKAITDKLFS